jgi:hypothetical protein
VCKISRAGSSHFCSRQSLGPTTIPGTDRVSRQDACAEAAITASCFRGLERAGQSQVSRPGVPATIISTARVRSGAMVRRALARGIGCQDGPYLIDLSFDGLVRLDFYYRETSSI